MKLILLVLVAAALFSGCVQPLPPSTTTKEFTPINTISPSPSISPDATFTPWIKTYPTKQALVIYGVTSRTQDSILFQERGDFEFEPILTLYVDGQLILGPGRYERQLSQQETADVLAKLEQLGFFQIQGTYAADSQNSIYVSPTVAVPDLDASLPSISITVESRTIAYLQSWENHLIQPIKDIVSYLNSFSPENAKPYQPDRLLVGMIDENAIPIPKDEPAIPWPDQITPPSQRSPYDGVLYLEGEQALTFYKILSENEGNIFSFDGSKFQVYARPILPNECHIYHFHPLENSSEQTQPYFSCNDW